jgi:dihydrofolate reductase/uncharacterized protein YndB with AHSA1/START domain
MGKIITQFTMSLDGFIAGPNDEVHHIFKWYNSGDVEFTVKGSGMVFKIPQASANLLQRGWGKVGAIVTGRRDFDVSNAWGGQTVLGVPTFIVTHSVPQEWVDKQPLFIFVTNGVESAVAQAKKAAGENNVSVGGTTIVQQCLKLGLIDEIQIDMAPILLGQGIRLFDKLGPNPIELEQTNVFEGKGVTHLHYRVLKSKEVKNLTLEKRIEINAPAAMVWRVFVDPRATRQLGGEYVSDWQVGSSIRFNGLDGTMLTDGRILQIEPERKLQHKLFNSVESNDSIITYELTEHGGATTLHAGEAFSAPLSDKDYADASQGWDAALLMVKEVAENL